MKRFIALGVAVAALAIVPVRPAAAQDVLRQDIVANMMDAGKKVMELADAFPEKKLAWRPGKGVRSANEVFMHVVGANYLFPTLLGATNGKTMEEVGGMEKMAPDKAKLQEMLKDSYEAASQAILGVPDSEMDAQVSFFGNMMSKRAIMLVLAAHSHEHLGQAIAYARTNGIVPPWTARQMEAAKKAAAEKKGGM